MGLKVLALGLVLSAIGLLVMPHQLRLGQILSTAFGGPSPERPRSLSGVILVAGGALLVAACIIVHRLRRPGHPRG